MVYGNAWLALVFSGLLLSCFSEGTVGSGKQEVGRPHTIAEAMRQLDVRLDEAEKNEMRETRREDLTIIALKYGMQMRYEWGLWHGSELALQFEGNGIFQPEDMTSLIIDLYWKRLNGLPLNLKESVAYFREGYDDLASRIDSTGIIIDDPAKVKPPPDPSKVKDEIIVMD